MKKIIIIATLMASCFTLSGCIIVPDGPGGPRAHGYYSEDCRWHRC